MDPIFPGSKECEKASSKWRSFYTESDSFRRDRVSWEGKSEIDSIVGRFGMNDSHLPGVFWKGDGFISGSCLLYLARRFFRRLFKEVTISYSSSPSDVDW